MVFALISVAIENVLLVDPASFVITVLPSDVMRSLSVRLDAALSRTPVPSVANIKLPLYPVLPVVTMAA